MRRRVRKSSKGRARDAGLMQIEWSEEELLKLAGVGTEAEKEVGEGVAPCSKIASTAWTLIVVSSSQPPLRLHLSGKTFAELIQEGARPELGSWTLPHLSHQDRPTSARLKRSRCFLPADGSSSFLESERSRVSARATRPVRFVRQLRFFAGRSDSEDQPPPGLLYEPPR